jgi:hypothetical protein
MSINITPYFKGAIALQAILLLFLFIATIWVLDSPRVQTSCYTALNRTHSIFWFYVEDVVAEAFFVVFFGALTVVIGVIGIKKESASILRHSKPFMIIEVFICYHAIVEMTFKIGQFRGEVAGIGWEVSGCAYLTSPLHNFTNFLLPVLVFKLPLVVLLDAYLKSIGDELSFLDYIFAWFYHVRNCIKYGRQGMSFTSSFIRTHVQNRLTKSVRVSQKNDTLFREVDIGSRMFGAITLDLFKENIANKYGRHPNDIIRLTKNGNVLLSDDADVSRINGEDFVEVEFEDHDRKLQEINSVMLEDSISETKILM